MKTYILILLTICGLSAVAQNEQPFKGAKKIIFECDETNADLYKKLGQQLTQNGFSIESANQDFLSIKTSPRATSKFNYSYYLQFSISENKIITSIFWKVNNSALFNRVGSDFFEWEYAKNKNNVQNIIHGDLMGYMNEFHRLKTLYQ